MAHLPLRAISPFALQISDDEDESLQVLASSLGRSSRPQPAGGRRRRGSASAAGGDEEMRVGSLEDEFGVGGSGSGGGGGGRRQRRNRPGRAGSVDRDLQVLGGCWAICGRWGKRISRPPLCLIRFFG